MHGSNYRFRGIEEVATDYGSPFPCLPYLATRHVSHGVAGNLAIHRIRLVKSCLSIDFDLLNTNSQEAAARFRAAG